MKIPDCPTGNTCPSIDKALASIERSIQSIQYVHSNIEDDTLKDELWNTLAELESLQGKRGMLEELRDDNSKLREWGYELNSIISDKDNEYSKLQDEFIELENEIDSLKSVLYSKEE